MTGFEPRDLVRADHDEDRRQSVVRFTKRGRAAYAKIEDVLRAIEHEWTAELGARQFAELKTLLVRVWRSPLTWPEPPNQSRR